MRRLGLLGALAVLLLPFGGASDRTLPLVGPAAATTPLTGLVYDREGIRLATVDPATLTATATSEVPGFYGGGWVRSPDGARVAVATTLAGQPGKAVLRFADPAALTWQPGGVELGGYFRAGIWPAPRTLVAVVQAGTAVGIETIDPATQTVVARSSATGVVLKSVRWRDGVWLLVGSGTGIKQAQLVHVFHDGVVRTTALARIRAGSFGRRTKAGGFIADTRVPALAVDGDGMAYVVDPTGLVATVDARSLAVRYHSAARSLVARLDAWLAPPAEAKALNGPELDAQWLGDGLIAVFGTSSVARNPSRGTYVYSFRPLGLKVLDTSTWRYRLLDGRVSRAVPGDGVLLATGNWWREPRLSPMNGGSGVAAFGPDGKLRWRVGDGTSYYVLSAFGNLAVVGKSSGGYDIVDVRTGKTVGATVAGPLPQLLLGLGS